MGERFVPLQPLGDRVWLGHDQRLDRPVVLKARNEGEAHNCLQFGAWAGMTLLDATDEFLVLERIGWPSLDQVLAEGSVRPDWVRAVLNGLCEKLRELEQLGFCYPDLKAEHICVSPTGQVRLCDLEGVVSVSPEMVRAGQTHLAQLCLQLAAVCRPLAPGLKRWASMATRQPDQSLVKGLALLDPPPRKRLYVGLLCLLALPALSPTLPNAPLAPPSVLMELRTR